MEKRIGQVSAKGGYELGLICITILCQTPHPYTMYF